MDTQQSPEENLNELQRTEAFRAFIVQQTEGNKKSEIIGRGILPRASSLPVRATTTTLTHGWQNNSSEKRKVNMYQIRNERGINKKK